MFSCSFLSFPAKIAWFWESKFFNGHPNINIFDEKNKKKNISNFLIFFFLRNLFLFICNYLINLLWKLNQRTVARNIELKEKFILLNFILTSNSRKTKNTPYIIDKNVKNAFSSLNDKICKYILIFRMAIFDDACVAIKKVFISPSTVIRHFNNFLF